MSKPTCLFKADLSRLERLEPGIVVAAAVGSRATGARYSQIKASLASLSGKTDWERVWAGAIRDGILAEGEDRCRLTPKGEETLRAVFPAWPCGDWETIRDAYLPLLALGIRGREMNGFSGRGRLEAAVVAVIYHLPVPPKRATPETAKTALLWKLIGSRFPEFDIKLSPSEKASNDPFSRRLLSLAAGQTTVDPARALKLLACRPLGITGALTPESLRKHLVKGSLEGFTAAQPEIDPDLKAFAERVQALTDDLTLPPFSNKVSIAQVYDAYGRRHADAGKLDDFKRRLVEAQKKELISLRRSDEPTLMDGELRRRSEIVRGSATFHFITKS